MRYLFFAVAFAVGLGLIDYYVYANFGRFARNGRRSLRILARVYLVLLFVMPLTLPAYLYFFRWWEVEPKLIRALFAGGWAVYYLPKIPIVAVLVLKDLAKLLTWQFNWLKRHRQKTAANDSAPVAPDMTELGTMSRAEFLRRMGWTAASIPFVAVGYGVFRSLYDFEIREQIVRIPHLPAGLDGIRIAHISDLHAGSFFSEKPVRVVVDRVNALKPDLLVFTGDFVNHDADELRLAIRYLQALSPDIGGFACLGNHDHYARVQDVVRAVADTPLTLLVNENRPLVVNGSRLYVLGTDNTGFRQNYADLGRTTRDIPVRRESDDLRILLTHDPSYWDQVRLERPDIDLTLCGHTHGGQLGFEFGPIRWSLARMAYPRWAGLYAESSDAGRPQYLYVNRGLGTVGPPIRVGIRPEITVLTLVRSERVA